MQQDLLGSDELSHDAELLMAGSRDDKAPDNDRAIRIASPHWTIELNASTGMDPEPLVAFFAGVHGQMAMSAHSGCGGACTYDRSWLLICVRDYQAAKVLCLGSLLSCHVLKLPPQCFSMLILTKKARLHVAHQQTGT